MQWPLPRGWGESQAAPCLAWHTWKSWSRPVLPEAAGGVHTARALSPSSWSCIGCSEGRSEWDMVQPRVGHRRQEWEGKIPEPLHCARPRLNTSQHSLLYPHLTWRTRRLGDSKQFMEGRCLLRRKARLQPASESCGQKALLWALTWKSTSPWP